MGLLSAIAQAPLAPIRVVVAIAEEFQRRVEQEVRRDPANRHAQQGEGDGDDRD